MTNNDEQKRAAGEAAALLVECGMVVGLGTGSTASHFVTALAQRRLGITCVATSAATEQQACALGLRLVALDQAERIDLTVDGADEIGPGLALIKGGGGALLREKLVWEASARCVVIADSGKRVAQFGCSPLPVEIVRFGQATTMVRIRVVLAACGIAAEPKLRGGEATPFVTDGGNVICDIACGAIGDPQKLAHRLKAITGVVEHGLFLGLAREALIGNDGGIVRVTG